MRPPTCVHPASLLLCAAIAEAALNISFSNGYGPDTLAPRPLPPPGASSATEEIIQQFTSLSRSTKWNLVDKIAFEGSVGEPEGMARVGTDRYFVAAGDWTEPTEKYDAPVNGTDRSAGAGFAHLIAFDGEGRRVADATVSRAGDTEYHLGGMDYDGTYLWATLSEYRPNSTATVVRMCPSSLEPEALFRVADHQGGIVHDLSTDDLVTLNWGARAASLWNPAHKQGAPAEFASPRSVTANPTQWIDYQDCKFLGRSRTYDNRAVMICGGIADIGGEEGQAEKFRLGGVAIVDMLSMVPLADVPIPMVTDKGEAVAKNPFDVAVVDGKLRFYFLPDEGEATLYVFEAE